jgi:elongation factor P
MIAAAQLRPGMVLKLGEDLVKVVESTFHVGRGKMPGVVHTKVGDVLKGTLKELRFRPEERLQDTQLERIEMEFLYTDADTAVFMDPKTFEQVPIPLEAIGAAEKYLKPEMMIPVEFYDDEPVSIVFPSVVEVRVESTAQSIHQQQDNTYKYAIVETGLEVLVPHFVKPGEVVRIEVATGRYVDRVRVHGRKV